MRRFLRRLLRVIHIMFGGAADNMRLYQHVSTHSSFRALRLYWLVAVVSTNARREPRRAALELPSQSPQKCRS
ncbi:hypothetical protein BKA56DRAFT_567295 [Ilyonectria sp. MPI-CAGE-AT-0026]|nr:hypothetical protein BKA56DRAFT_567295 [Ilyonectria sp. MPI-CAGE-AT-0026]